MKVGGDKYGRLAVQDGPLKGANVVVRIPPVVQNGTRTANFFCLTMMESLKK